MDFSKQKFRCSSLGGLLSNMPGKKDTKNVNELSETAKGVLLEIYIEAKYKREKEVFSKYLEKGLMVEEDSLTLISRHDKKVYIKNERRYENDILSGEPDVVDNKEVLEVLDVKSSWDIFTFFKSKFSKTDKGYHAQGQGYLDLVGGDVFKLCYCLIDTPEILIGDEKRKLAYKMGLMSENENNPVYEKACELIDRNMRYDDIPLKERVHKIIIPKDNELIDSVYSRAPIWREFLDSIDKPELVTI